MVVVKVDGIVACTIVVPVFTYVVDIPWQVTVRPPLLVVNPAPELHALPTGSDGVSYDSPLLRIFNVSSPVHEDGQPAVNDIDSPSSEDSASAPTISHPVAETPSGVETEMLLNVIVVVEPFCV